MFIAKYIFPVLLLFFASNSYAEITSDKVQRFYESIVSIRSIVPPEARTAASLGVEREGNGVAIDEKPYSDYWLHSFRVREHRNRSF